MTFEWNARKAAVTLWKHRVSFEDAAGVFLDPLATTFPDPDRSSDEHREITIGCTIRPQVRGAGIRIISARLATAAERKQDEEGIGS